MKLVIFGASGRTGIPLVEQALAVGNDVVAAVRTPAKLPIQHERLTVLPGDVMNRADVERAVAGGDVLLLALGHTKNSPADMQAVATRHILAAMQKHGVKRLVSLTGAGVAAPQDKPKLFNHLIKFALKTLSGAVLKDAEDHIRLIQAQPGLEWVVVRVPMLTDGPRTGNYRVGWVGVNTGPRIARADVADFMLKQVSDNRFVGQMPMISD